MGLHIRVGTDDRIWKYPNSDERFSSNLEMFDVAKEIATHHSSRPATANEMRQLYGMPLR